MRPATVHAGRLPGHAQTGAARSDPPVVIEAHLPASSADPPGLVTGLAIEIPGRPDPLAVRILRQGHAGVVDQRSRAVVLRFEVENHDGRLLVGQAGTALLR